MRIPTPTMLLVNRHGFTLAELLVVTAVIGLLTVLAAPYLLGELSRLRVHGATRRIAWEIMAARVQAISKNQKVMVQFPNHYTYAIGPDSNNNGVLDTGEARTTNLPSAFHQVTLATTDNFTFHPKGTSDKTAIITVSNPNQTRHITVTVAGMVKIH